MTTVASTNAPLAVRPETGVTIDGPTTRDIDDAVWVESANENGAVLHVYVADVQARVLRGTPEDDLARRQAETIYRAWGNRTMLLRPIENKASLFPSERRRTVAIDIQLSPTLDVSSFEVRETPFKSRHRLSYGDVPVILGTPSHSLYYPLHLAADVARGLLARRRADGALALYDLNNGWLTTEEGAIRRIQDRRDTIGQILIQEFMILANRLLARWAIDRGVPVLFRNHTVRDVAPDRQALLAAIEEALARPVDVSALRQYVHVGLNRAEYGAEPKGHYGLNLSAYLHGTSPIRRYADLVTQRQIVAAVRGETLPYGQAELVEVAAHLNRVISERRDAEEAAQAEAGKTKAVARAERAMEKDRMRNLDATQFERVVKVAARAGTDPSPAFAEEYLRRLSAGRLPPLHLYVILVEAPRTEAWRSLRQAVLDYLTAETQHGPSIAGICASVGGWKPVEFSAPARTGADHALSFKVGARLERGDGASFSALGAARAVKVAQQRAIVGALALAVDLNPPSWPVGEMAPTPTAPVAVPDPGSNPVGVLNEYAQQVGAPPPEYVYESCGTVHAPAFRCTVRFRDASAVSEAYPNKGETKREAAARMLAGLRR